MSNTPQLDLQLDRGPVFTVPLLAMIFPALPPFVLADSEPTPWPATHRRSLRGRSNRSNNVRSGRGPALRTATTWLRRVDAGPSRSHVVGEATPRRAFLLGGVQKG